MTAAPRQDRGGALARRLTLGDAISIGLGSMIGAGVFAAFAPAAAAAGAGLLVGLVIAGFIAFCNATSSAQLAAQYPTSGGTYVYGRERLGAWAGFFAGWSFVVGKTASSAAMALTFATYAVPGPWVKPVAIAAVAVLTLVNSVGVTRTALLTRILVAIALVALTVAVVIGFTHTAASASQPGPQVTGYGVLQSAGFLFFAFAGYARIATMGEEVVEPERTIPRAIVTALGITLVVYALVAVPTLHALGAAGLADVAAPLGAVADTSGAAWPGVVIRIGAAAAALGALLAMIAGIGRTSLAMARESDLPRWFAAVHPRFRVPYRAELAVGLVVCVLVAVTDMRGAIGFSSFGVLLYYLIANASAWTQDRAHRRYPRLLAVAGAVGCVVLVATLPVPAIVAGIVVIAIGIGYRFVRLRVARRPPREEEIP
ncbi:APC family permease [Leifsonia sp. 21MFCrub1.1]|uniref:APC family permease n=1 Tax=Leifsonia sp. 21MFCrub1.1 TaxID=1798223 RepID=UPI0008929609|nr:APC family permease [Leifsonia sp. 21MFCrub1.1]SEA38094.1 amino acid/polyamine/organocation transporter, APC superfamily [Leifsonia sp. 21MFCrub1.1]